MASQLWKNVKNVKNLCVLHNKYRLEVTVSRWAQFYIQLLYRSHFGTWILPFGLLGSTVGSKWKISETTEFLLKYATFWGGFFMFSWAKIKFLICLHCSVCTKILLDTKGIFFLNGKNFWGVKNRLPLMIFWSEIMREVCLCGLVCLFW